MTKNIKFLLAIVLLCMAVPLAVAQTGRLLQSGPMVGYADKKEVMLWVQTTQAAQVRIEYFEQGKPAPRFRTAEVGTNAAQAFTARLLADKVEPGRKYTYELFINNKRVALNYPLAFQSQMLWEHRTDPPAFKFVAGSCAYVNEPEVDRPGKPYGGDFEIFKSILAQQPDFMMWLGDNVYLREVDWNTRSGVIHRYTHSRSQPELQPLLGSVHHYGIWDDHDYGPNDSDRSYWLKETTDEVFKLFWPNPNFVNGAKGGVTGTFMWNDAQFFLLDNRYFRSPNDLKIGKRVIIGDDQLQWLIDALAFSKAPFKFVAIGGQVLNPDASFERYAAFPEERERLLSAIREANIPGVIFLTGDVHHGELTRMDRPGTYPLYDLTSSPLTAGTYSPEPANNTMRVPGTLVTERNFATLEVTGPRRDRVLTIRMHNTQGKELWNKVIRAQELR